MSGVIRDSSRGRWRLRISGASRGLALVALSAIACSSSSRSGSDAGSGGPTLDSGAGGGDDGGSDASGDVDEGGGPGFCISTGDPCDATTICCAGGTCTPGDAGATCQGGAVQCLSRGQPCSATISCCNGSSNCGTGTTNTCP